jgi:hypothetical protein
LASKARCVTCDDCFFRKAHLCALALSEPCPTFRPAASGAMVPPRQPRLVVAANERVLIPASGLA